MTQRLFVAGGGMPAPVVEVWCRVPGVVARRRYRERVPTRLTGDLQAQRPDTELCADAHRTPLGMGTAVWVDTDGPVDIAATCDRATAHHRYLASAAPVVTGPARHVDRGDA
jgi:hypothetical protein